MSKYVGLACHGIENTDSLSDGGVYMDDEMLERAEGSEGDATMARDVSDGKAAVVCAIEHGGKRQKACLGQKRRLITVTQWDASARKQMIRQLDQRGVTV